MRGENIQYTATMVIAVVDAVGSIALLAIADRPGSRYFRISAFFAAPSSSPNSHRFSPFVLSTFGGTRFIIGCFFSRLRWTFSGCAMFLQFMGQFVRQQRLLNTTRAAPAGRLVAARGAPSREHVWSDSSMAISA